MRNIVALALLTFSFAVVAEAHPGNVRRSDCTHVVRGEGESSRHRHTGRPYCNQRTDDRSQSPLTPSRDVNDELVSQVSNRTISQFASSGRNLLAHAMSKATETLPSQIDGCLTAVRAGNRDGRERQGSIGWTIGGVFLPIVMPIFAHVTTPQPPTDTVLTYSGDDARCYSSAYSSAASSKRKKGAWIGTAISVGLMFLLN